MHYQIQQQFVTTIFIITHVMEHSKQIVVRPQLSRQSRNKSRQISKTENDYCKKGPLLVAS